MHISITTSTSRVKRSIVRSDRYNLKKKKILKTRELIFLKCNKAKQPETCKCALRKKKL
jgi:hypothetical protein